MVPLDEEAGVGDETARVVAHRRMGVFALVVALLHLWALIVHVIVPALGSTRAWHLPAGAASALVIVGGLLVWRRSCCPPRRRAGTRWYGGAAAVFGILAMLAYLLPVGGSAGIDAGGAAMALAIMVVLAPLLLETGPVAAITPTLLAAPVVALAEAAPGATPGASVIGVLVAGLCGLVAAAGIAEQRRRVLHRSAHRTSLDLGGYLLQRRIGSGGMGEVWTACHRLLHRPAAIKLIRPHAFVASESDEAPTPENPEAIAARFEQEAQATSRLRSQHTIEIFDFGRTLDGRFYYAMELLDGIDLHLLVNEHGPQHPGRVVHILRQACLSLAEAHASGLIHRDVKPANILLCRFGFELDAVKVLDFGIALAAAGHRSGRARGRITDSPEVIGTPGYMAPEVIAGDAHIDHRVDLYSLGCIAWWLLTGREVFAGPSAVQVLIRHSRDDPGLPSEVADQAVPADLESVIMACLAKDPRDRPATAMELCRLLDACGCAGDWGGEEREDWWSEARIPTRITC